MQYYISAFLNRSEYRVLIPGVRPNRLAKCRNARLDPAMLPWKMRFIFKDKDLTPIFPIQIKRLRDAGIDTLKGLAKCKKNVKVPKMAPETLEKLRHQARLQFQKRETGENICDLLPPDPDEKRGFARPPRPVERDIFFDMEDDPMEGDGLEYLNCSMTVTASGRSCI